MPIGFRCIILLLALSPLRVISQPSAPLLQPALQSISSDAYRARLETLRDLVRACRDDAKACDPSAVGEDNTIESSSEIFQVRWLWLRRLIDDARDPSLPQRNQLLDQATARLDDELGPTGADAKQLPEFGPARRAVDSILARTEFRSVSSESWLDRKIAEFWSWVNRFFNAASGLGHRAPWLGPVLEWSFVGLAALSALIWARRVMERERIATSLGAPALAADWKKESAEWAELAQAEADAGNWREAIHCVYWASIVALESRRLWRRDYARTPREYVELLERDSTRQRSLRRLTSIFERIWYGLRVAAREDYLQALTLFNDLKRV